jgi:hypothetical protein
MSVATWPAGLPQKPERDGFALGAADGRLVSETEVGPGKRRRRWPGLATWQMSMWLTASQRDLFLAFWESLSGGSSPFWFPDFSTDGEPLTTESDETITTETGEEIDVTIWNLAQFAAGSQPSIGNKSAALWPVSFALQVLP